jgi:hypothetical protein
LGWPDKERSPLQNTHAADAESPHNLTSGQLQRILAVMEKGSLGYASLTLNGAFRQNMAGVFNRPDVLEVSGSAVGVLPLFLMPFSCFLFDATFIRHSCPASTG